MNTREGGVNCSFGVLKRGKMWLSKVARRGVKSNVISKISLDIALDADTFMVLGVLEFWESEKAETP